MSAAPPSMRQRLLALMQAVNGFLDTQTQMVLPVHVTRIRVVANGRLLQVDFDVLDEEDIYLYSFLPVNFGHVPGVLQAITNTFLIYTDQAAALSQGEGNVILDPWAGADTDVDDDAPDSEGLDGAEPASTAQRGRWVQ